METKKKQDPVFEEADKIREYFKEDDIALQDLFTRLGKLQGISDKQIDEISQATPGRGTQHYLVEHMANAISIQTQMQSILKDKRAIKEKALEIALKNMRGEDIGDGSEILASLQKLIKEQKTTAENNVENLENKIESSETSDDAKLDEEIEKKLGL